MAGQRCFFVVVSFFFLMEFCCGQNPDIGRVFIGDISDAGSPSVSAYSFGFYERTGQSLPIYALVFREGNPAVIGEKTEDITVTCTVSDTSSGFSAVQILDVTLSAAVNVTNIPLTLGASGRSVTVQCSGQSTAVNASCPVSLGGSQFCPETSASNTVSVVIRPQATISLCEPEITVSNEVPGATYTFPIRLSEEVVQPTDIDCTVSGGLGLNILSQTVQPRNISVEMRYTVNNPTTGNSATVTCSAQSRTGNQFTSLGSSGPLSSALFKLRTNTFSFEPRWSAVYNMSFTSLLTLSSPVTSGSVQVACRASVVASLDDAEAEIGSPDCSFSPSSTDPASSWAVVDSVFDIPSLSNPAQTSYKPVTAQRLSAPVDTRIEVVVTTCCVQSSSSNSQYQGQSAVAVAVANLKPLACKNCNATDGISQTLLNPGYVEVAPCPCDLTKAACDFNCCCDEDCNAAERDRFSECLPGLEGGQGADPARYSCSSKAFDLPDWQPLTCVFYENNAYLGLFYANVQKLSSLEQVQFEASSKYKGRFSLSETESRYENKDTTTASYSYGVSVSTLRADQLTTGRLALSQGGPGGFCNPLSPVQFLVDSEAVCAVTLTQGQCVSNTVFSGNVYAVSSAIQGCSQSFKVTSTFQGTNLAPADVRYYCATDVSGYLSSTPGTTISDLDPQVSSNFPADLSGLQCNDGCSEAACWQYNTGRSSSDVSLLPGQCSWDSGFTPPLMPAMNGATCENVVLEVRYNFEWSGSEITKLTADVILGNIPNVGAGDVSLMQKFSVNWQAKPNASLSLSDNYQQTLEPYARSGTGGYELGESLPSGCAEYNSTTGQFQQVDTRTEKQMAIWKPGTDGLCANAERETLTFGDDAESSCILQLNFDYLNNSCEELRELITNHLNVLMASSVIGKTGYNDLTSEDMWIPVLRQNLSEVFLMATGDISSNTSSLNESEPLFSWAERIPGICLVPSGAELIVLYAQTGARDYYPRLEVLGAYINYTVSNWTMNCAGANSQRCSPGSTFTQNFFVSSSVRFVKVPPVPPAPRIRFYTKFDLDNCDSDSCYRFFTDFVSDVCYYDTCWQELAYPLTEAYHGESRHYTLPFFLLTVLGVIGYVAVTKPGWS
ncbi:uncharacterized protein LOC101855231 [Aplysia californica]|uniref:Uncharacterized protein LOC101855231 n=1 Tax=Aplysia californica TaxID=6500 RepID=A0ABM0JE30_APLCA|nr:uncharacterized protein LOC101855231 [Aplysia californica]